MKIKMNYSEQRNTIIRKYIDYGSRLHLNCIRHDPKSSDKHKDKIEEICRHLRKNNIDFICRPIINWINLIPDILAFSNPKTLAIEVINSENKEHAESKNYPSEFKVVSLGVDDELEGVV